MKVLILNTNDIAGGAAKAAYRLHKALIARGVTSRMAVQYKSSGDNNVIGPVGSFRNIWPRLRSALDSAPTRVYRQRSRTSFGVCMLANPWLLQQIRAQRPDVVHLHWVCGGFLSTDILKRIHQPVVWSLHDMWAFTGGCHYDESCGRFKTVCGRCPVLGSSKTNDLSTWVFRRKQKAFESMRRLTVIGLSQWITECSRASSLLSTVPTVHLPNCIDTSAYRQMHRNEARLRLKLPLEGRLLLFTAARPTWDPRKGWNHLLEALKRIPLANNKLVVAGDRTLSVPTCTPIPVHNAGQLNDDTRIAALFSACDLTVVPSIQENFSNVIMESLLCGTPVVAFDVGGNRDLVEHLVNGYLAQPFNSMDLARGMEWVLENEERRMVLGRNGRRKIEYQFCTDRVAEQYIQLYEKALSA